MWRSDGTPEGTFLIKDIDPTGDGVPEYAIFGNRLFFAGQTVAEGSEPWITDGSPGNGQMVKDINPGPAGSDIEITEVVNGIMLFSAIDDMHGRVLWRSDGTPGGTRLLKDINPTGSGGELDGAGGFGARWVSVRPRCSERLSHNG